MLLSAFLFLYVGNAIAQQESNIPYNCSCKMDSIAVYGEFPEKMPEFPGGVVERIRFFHNNFSYPQEQLKDTNHILQTKFYLSFVVDTNGIIRNRCIVKTLWPDRLTPAEKEALRMLDIMPPWIPAVSNGKKVAVKLVFPLNVELK